MIDSRIPSRFDAALTISDGACNPVGIASAIFDYGSKILHSKGTQAVREDPAIRLMVHQLAYLCGVDELNDDLFAYGKIRDICKEKYESNRKD